MRPLLFVLAILVLCGCVGDGYRLGTGSTGPLPTEPDPFELLGRDLPMGMRLDLAAARATAGGPEFDMFMNRFVGSSTPMPAELARDLLERTDVAVLGARPGPGNESAEVLILRGRYADVDVVARWTSEPRFVPGEHRGRVLWRSEDGTVARLDDHLLVIGDGTIVTQVLDRAIDHVRAAPASPAVAAGWDFGDTQLIAVVLPTTRIREEMRRSPPYDGVAETFERARLRVVKTGRGEYFEVQIETTSPIGARDLATAIRDEIAELARDPYADVTGLSALLHALRVEVDGGAVRIVGEAHDEEVARCARRVLEVL